MRRFSIAAMFACATISLGLLSVPAKAGDYYDSGYRYRDSGNVRYSTQCCFKKVVRVVRSVRFVRVDEGRSYYNDRYRQSYSWGSPRRYSNDFYAPRYVSNDYAPRRYVSSNFYGNGYSGYAQNCSWRRDKFYDGQGGWYWGESRRVCN